MRKNKSTIKNNYRVNRQKLINKISDAMSIKYSNFFTAANYDNKSLKQDVDKLINSQYFSKDPKDVFKPIETNILDKVRQNNPQLQLKIKKARKLPEIKYTKDKYQEADEREKEEKKIIGSLVQKKTLPNKKKNLSEYKALNRNRNISQNYNIKLTDINNNDTKKKEEKKIYDTLKIPEEYLNKHTLVDKLKNRIKYDPTIKYLEEDQKLYEKEQEEKKQKKLLKQKSYLNELNMQIDEQKKRKEQERKNQLKEYEEFEKQIIIEKEKITEEQMNDQIKREKLKETYEKIMKEKAIIRRRKKLDEDKENKIFSELLKKEMDKEKKDILDKKNKIKEDILKAKEINEKLAKERMNLQKQNNQNENIEQENDLFKPNSLSNNIIKDRINRRILKQEAAANYLSKIYNSLEQQSQDVFLTEQNNQDLKKKLEYENIDKNRQMKIEDYKKGLLDNLAYKNRERKKKKEEDEKYRKSLEEEYALYLQKEKEKKLKQFEKYENYRKALEEQIKENKMRDVESLKYI